MQQTESDIEDKVLADHNRVMNKLCLCRYVIGYVKNTDNQIEISLDPPIEVIVNGPVNPEHGLFHYTDGFIDPYWDIEFTQPIDPRVDHLRSVYTHGPSYNLNTGEMEACDQERPMCWLKPKVKWIEPKSIKTRWRFYKIIRHLFGKGN